MARNTVTEADLGLEPTEEELASPAPVEGEDIPLADDPAEENAEPAKAEKTEAEPEKGKEPPAEEPKTVDLRALQEARAEARAAKQHASLLEQRWNDFLAGQGGNKQSEKTEPVIPNASDDPLAAMQWTQEQLIAMQKAQQETATQAAERQREEQQFQQAFASVSADFETAAKADPTIQQAYSRLMESQGNELLAMGYTVPQAKQELAKIERQHIQYVANRGLNIADYVKALASARGWSPQAQAAAGQQPAAKAQPDLAAVANAQQRHMSLSDAPGGEAPPVLDAKALARMSDKEFKAWMAQKGNDAKFEQIMGKD